MTDSQLPLVPDKPVVFVSDRIPLDELPPDVALIGPPPTKALVESIRRLGIIDPVIVEDLEHSYAVTDGRRRVKAARAAGLTHVPARIYGCSYEDGWMPSALSIVTHATRAENPVSEYEAIALLESLGYTHDQISRATGLTKQTIRKRMKLASLHPALRDAAAAGKIKTTVAERAAKLSSDQQARLVDVLKQQGKLTGRDVSEAKQAQRERAAAAIPFDVITETPEVSFGADITRDIAGSPLASLQPFRDACRAVIEAMRQGQDENTLYGLIHDLADAFEQAEQEGII